MNDNKLTQKMLEYAEAKAKADALEAEIKAAVLEIGKTQTAGSVKATYRKGRKSYDYETAVKTATVKTGLFEAYLANTTQPKPRTDWRQVCKDVDIKDVPFTIGKPAVKVVVTDSVKKGSKNVHLD